MAAGFGRRFNYSICLRELAALRPVCPLKIDNTSLIDAIFDATRRASSAEIGGRRDASTPPRACDGTLSSLSAAGVHELAHYACRASRYLM